MTGLPVTSSSSLPRLRTCLVLPSLLAALSAAGGFGAQGCGFGDPTTSPDPTATESEASDSDSDSDAEELTPGAAEPTAEQRAHLGTVRGVVRLAEGAELPEYTAAEMGRTGSDLSFPAQCSPHRPEDHRPVRLADGRGLSTVLVTATGDRTTFFQHLPERRPQEHRLFIDDCRLEPRLTVAVRGDSLVVQNRTRQPLFPLVGAGAFTDSLMFGETRLVPLDRGGVNSVRCAAVPHCGRSDLVVVMNPVVGMTGEAGSFELTNVPADQDIEVHAWHPLFRAERVATRVAPGEVTTVDLVLTPLTSAERAVSAAAAAPPVPMLGTQHLEPRRDGRPGPASTEAEAAPEPANGSDAPGNSEAGDAPAAPGD